MIKEINFTVKVDTATGAVISLESTDGLYDRTEYFCEADKPMSIAETSRVIKEELEYMVD